MQPLIVTAGILRRNGRILITLRPPESSHPGFWEFPGGKLAPDESPEAALRREFQEELDLGITVDQIFTVVYHRYSWGPVLLLVYDCSWVSGTIRHLGVSDHAWANLEELSRYRLLPADRPIVARLQKGTPPITAACSDG